jgi:hypothetical protein
MTLVVMHVLISLLGIASGLVVVIGLLAVRRLHGWTALFLTTTVATSVTGFVLPADHVLPSHVVGALSLLVLTIAIVARYPRDLAGPWRGIYVISAVTALYLNVFVGIFQAFLKVPALKAAAPTQSEPPFLLTQSAALVAFIVIGAFAVIKFRREPLDGRPPARPAISTSPSTRNPSTTQ